MEKYEIGQRITFQKDGLSYNGTISNKSYFHCYILGDDGKRYVLDWGYISSDSPQSVYF